VATTKAKIIKINDLSKAIDQAVAASAGKAKIPGGLIMGRMMTQAAAKNLDVNALARDITKQMGSSLSGFKLTPKVSIGDGWITMGFIAREVEILNG
jgi:hypothetical protein